MGKCFKDCDVDRRTFPGGDCESCDDERMLWDSIATEPARLSGTAITYYRLRRARNRHPLYKEPTGNEEWSHDGPWEMMASLEFSQSDNISPEATETGIRFVSDAIAYVSRKEFEDVRCPYPKTGDIVEFWSEPPFGDEKRKSQWDVVKATRDGNVWSTPEFVQYKLELKRRSEYYAFRKTMEEPYPR